MARFLLALPFARIFVRRSVPQHPATRRPIGASSGSLSNSLPFTWFWRQTGMMQSVKLSPVCFALCAALTFLTCASAQQLTPHPIHLANGKSLVLNLPADFTIDVAAEGLKRVRFMARSPDNRIFATDMHDLGDNQLGKVYVLEGWNEKTHRFAKITPYLDHLRNPNNLAFYTEPQQNGQPGQSWLYLPLTDRLLRYKYNPGDNAPSSPPEVLAHYPDYGLNYKYGGWHLTRTVAFATLHGKTSLYVTVGSSCNACREKEEVRATLTVMDPDGSHQEIIARGLRNAVGMEYIPSIDGGALFATNMGADHLGDRDPEDTFFELDSETHPVPPGSNYGWPTCYFDHGQAHADRLIADPKPTDRVVPAPPVGPPPPQFDCTKIPAVYATFAPHSSPLGLEYFDGANSALAGSFLVALHGASHPKIGTGYRVVRFDAAQRQPQDFITGFLVNGKVTGRPCGIVRTGPDAFLLTDDHDGAIYYVHPK
jgi:glucose/arabinose dehydrogenase